MSRWLVLPINAHLSIDSAGHPKMFSQWAYQLGASFDQVDRIIFSVGLNKNHLALIDITVQPTQSIRISTFVVTHENALSTVMIVQDTLAKDCSGSFQCCFHQDLDPSRSYLSTGTVICAKIVQLLTKSLTMSTLSATAVMIQRSIHFGRVDALLPINPRTGWVES